MAVRRGLCGNGVLKAWFMIELARVRMVASPSFLNEPLAWSLGFGIRRVVLGAPLSSIAIRLFANMMSGHILLKILISFI
jgi:F0F1-type ATP synthase membrane subunit a